MENEERADFRLQRQQRNETRSGVLLPLFNLLFFRVAQENRIRRDMLALAFPPTRPCPNILTCQWYRQAGTDASHASRLDCDL